MNKIKVIGIQVPTEKELALITDAARLTQVKDYSFTGQYIPKLAQKLLTMGHYAPFEFVDMTVFIKGCSRTFLAQITRHRLCSFMSSSQQYQHIKIPDFVIPCGLSEEQITRYIDSANENWEVYNELEKEVGRDQARYILPNACRVDLLIKANLREWLTVIIPQRSCKRNTTETQYIIREICQLLPYDLLTGPECLTLGKCNQGSMACNDTYQCKGDLLQ